MIFGPLPIARAPGAVLAHAVTAGERRLKKGRVLDADDLAALEAAGIAEVVAAILEPGDVGEDRAATRAAACLSGPGLSAGAAFTGRVNLFADAHGLLTLARDEIDRLNRIDEALTIATLAPLTPVEPGQMVATVKVIPFAAPERAVAAWERIAAARPPLGLAPFRPRPVALIQTVLPGLKTSVLDKTVEVTRRRLAALGSPLVAEARVAHRAEAVAEGLAAMRAEGAELVLIAGASAIIDRRDVIPAGLVAAGGRIEHFGMPVDPGNLLLLGALGNVPVLGLPGCARSPKLNGIDWVLQRLLADLPVGRTEITGFGAGGLLAEIPSRPLPRAEIGTALASPRRAQIAALVLAAGQSRRMGADNKLLIALDGKPMVRHVAEMALASRARPVIVVLGHQPQAVRAALDGLDVRFVENPHYGDGLSGSLKSGLAAVPDSADGAVVCLGDMPGVAADLVDRLIAGFNPVEGRAILAPVRSGRRGNPVLWARRFFGELMALSGDTGAKHLIGNYAEFLTEIEAADDGVLIDLDTPDAVAAYRTGS
ncbi:MAG TPA: molybdopterin-binding/glycosyltransferase family 2 protein [Aliidongia sp.]|uniref:molybdopterin-binding/glycosyltransferase family 2 protein n=1 Tax=Aliidongia sp. TaxID=1914230 RepID=UPI002DDDA7F2|nr:molybdopterin-binding/glycosyltransferase family 2 protein [Aliidongia sp.]HEV2676952.1 molybdopterin-binding/glycosyltransferase family 2 protein [Aliidongia sp.]